MNGLTLLDTRRGNDRLRAIPILILTNFDDPDTAKRENRELLRKGTDPSLRCGADTAKLAQVDNLSASPTL